MYTRAVYQWAGGHVEQNKRYALPLGPGVSLTNQTSLACIGQRLDCKIQHARENFVLGARQLLCSLCGSQCASFGDAAAGKCNSSLVKLRAPLTTVYMYGVHVLQVWTCNVTRFLICFLLFVCCTNYWKRLVSQHSLMVPMPTAVRPALSGKASLLWVIDWVID